MKPVLIAFVLGLLFPLPIGWFVLGLLGSLWDTTVQKWPAIVAHCRWAVNNPARLFVLAWMVVFLFFGRHAW